MSAPALARWMSQPTAITAGLVVSALGGVPLVLVGSTGGLPLVMLGIGVLALGTGPLFALGTGLVVGSVPQEREGSAASMSETGNYFGSSLGLAVLGALGAAVYRGHLAAVGAPSTADQTLAGATAVSRHLPPGQAAALLHAARDAFTSGLNVTGVVAVGIFAGLAVLTAVLRPAAEPRQAPAEVPEAARA